MFDGEVMWGIAYTLTVLMVWLLVLSTATQVEGPTYCYIESFDTLTAAAASLVLRERDSEETQADDGRNSTNVYQPF